MAWRRIASTDDVQAGHGKEFNIDDKRIALFNQDGYYAMDGICPHQDGSIAPGELDGDVVECPLHAWHFNFKTGELQDYVKGVKLTTYKTKVENNEIYIDM
ncbi:MAG: Rieske 2Fe-2S domain-containing protein [Candidatus Nitrosoabyssus spongiisocia]|nr:MAG: Rieske 2Fe-2S domain-containing protein [Nitrosopumilaceae archaeon AB1(1)]